MLQDGYERFLLGREVCLLMGMVVHSLHMDIVSDSAPWLSIIINLTVLSGIYVINFLNLVHPCDCPFEPEVLHDMAGNSMAVRSIMAAICAAISATEPQLMSHNDFV